MDDLELLKFQLNVIEPDIIFNCGAYTAVDKAESDKELAFKINHFAVASIAKYASENEVKLIHISTDYVFDGSSSIALSEDSKTNPINIYGESKRAGELDCLKKIQDQLLLELLGFIVSSETIS